MDFLSKMHVSDLIWQLPDLIWHLLDRKVGVLDGMSKVVPKKMSIFDWRGAHRCHHAGTKRKLFLKSAGPPV